MAEPPIDGLKAIAHPLRYAILAALSGAELNVGEIETATGITQPALSQQLSILRNAGLVTSRRDAKMVYYRGDEHTLGALAAAVHSIVPAKSKVPADKPGKKVTGAAVFARLR
ncbi:ArsR/SmtB family transcription factor [Croceicoccus estronivorus]|uniref:ArsR/SmtB family transcription factor n=1 Tax=Croceicoccus estronivorus TaxID=1172626 RepID=UPI000B31F941|nr:metalloregulator ArsR/SmtB family transcription factor [Croceicoccus estronivorus]